MLTVQQIGEMLALCAFPATREELIAAMQRLDAPADVLQRLECIPDYRYGSLNSVLDAIRAQQ